MPNGNSDTFSWFRPLHYHRIPISNFKIGIPSNFLIGEQIRIWPFPKHFLQNQLSYIWKNPVFLANQNSMCSYLTVKFWVVGVFLTFRFHTLTVRKIFCLLYFDRYESFEHQFRYFHSFSEILIWLLKSLCVRKIIAKEHMVFNSKLMRL